MKIARIFVPALFSLVACASSGSSQNSGLTGTGEGPSASDAKDANPDGVAYPKDNIGTKPRSGSTPGNKIQNYKFLGYPNGDRSGGLKPISLADYFDPTGARYKLIHIQASGSWCVYCQAELETLVPMKADLDSRKVAWIVSLAEGPATGTPAKTSDLDEWLAEFKAPYTHVLDPGNKYLGVFYDAAALPWNADINAKTMEILESGVGARTTREDILSEVDGWLDQINNGTIK